VSRYKFEREQVISQGTQGFIAGTCAVSRYKLTTEPEISQGTEPLLRPLVRCPGGAIYASCYRKQDVQKP